MKSAPAVIMWARGALNFTTPLKLGFLAAMVLTSDSYLALPVPRITTCALLILGSACFQVGRGGSGNAAVMMVVVVVVVVVVPSM